jgi:hypothetical protein
LGYVNQSCSPWSRGFDSYLGYLNGNEGYYRHGMGGYQDFHECAANQSASAAGPQYEHLQGALPSGGEATGVAGGAVQNVSLADAEALCAAADGCFGITFEADAAAPSGVLKVYFKKEAHPNGDAHWQTYVKSSLPPQPWPPWPPAGGCGGCTARYEEQYLQ